VTPLLPSLQALDSLGGIDGLCLWVRVDERPLRGLASFVDWRLCGYLSQLLKTSFFCGEPEEALLLAGGGCIPCRRIFVWGLGGAKEWTRESVEQHIEKTQKKLRLAGVSSLAMSTPEGVFEEFWQKACERHFSWVSTFVLFRPMSCLKGTSGTSTTTATEVGAGAGALARKRYC